MPPSLITHSLSLQPAKTAWVWGSTNPGITTFPEAYYPFCLAGIFRLYLPGRADCNKFTPLYGQSTVLYETQLSHLPTRLGPVQGPSQGKEFRGVKDNKVALAIALLFHS